MSEDKNGVTTGEWVSKMAARTDSSIHHKLGRFLWVRITTRLGDRTEEEKATAFNSITARDRDRWWTIAQEVLEVIEALRAGEDSSDTSDLARESRKHIAKALRYIKDKMLDKGLNADEKLKALAFLPKLAVAIRDLSKVEQDEREKGMAAWRSLTNEEKIDSFLMAAETWPAVHREYMATRIRELFPEAWREADRARLSSVK